MRGKVHPHLKFSHCVDLIATEMQCRSEISCSATTIDVVGREGRGVSNVSVQHASKHLFIRIHMGS